MLTLLGGGGVLALLACAGCGVGGYFAFFAGPRIAGQWMLVEPPLNGVLVTIEFRRNGTGTIAGPSADVHFDYTVTDDDPMQLQWRITRIDNKNRPIGGFGFGRFNRPIGPIGLLMNNQNLVGAVERFRVTFENNMLITTPQNGGATLKWRRVR